MIAYHGGHGNSQAHRIDPDTYGVEMEDTDLSQWGDDDPTLYKYTTAVSESTNCFNNSQHGPVRVIYHRETK